MGLRVGEGSDNDAALSCLRCLSSLVRGRKLGRRGLARRTFAAERVRVRALGRGYDLKGRLPDTLANSETWGKVEPTDPHNRDLFASLRVPVERTVGSKRGCDW